MEPRTNGEILVSLGNEFFSKSDVISEPGVRRLRDYLHGGKDENLDFDAIADNYIVLLSFVTFVCRAMPNILFKLIRQVTSYPASSDATN